MVIITEENPILGINIYKYYNFVYCNRLQYTNICVKITKYKKYKKGKVIIKAKRVEISIVTNGINEFYRTEQYKRYEG